MTEQFLFQAYMKIYQGEELPHPKSMLQVSSPSLSNGSICWLVNILIFNQKHEIKTSKSFSGCVLM